jgi:ubiquitin carboxyl-terminal hydrolase 5/13
MEVLQANLSKINVPNAQSAIYKDECAYTFHTPESDGGLLLDLNSFIGFSPEYALLNFQRTGHAVYLNISKKRVPKKQRAHATDASGAAKVVGLAAVNFFDRDANYEMETSLAIVLLPDYSRIPLPNVDIPMKVQMAVDAVMALEAAGRKEEVNSLLLTNESVESKYAKDLLQLENGVKIPHSGWKCEQCDKTKNLWLNLTDGAILCGRQIKGSALSGNGHALEHYNATGFPLVVKLGTITPDGQADVYSYAVDENDSVLDPYLEQHLLHWGIDLKELKKTEKTVAELEAELQLTYEWSKIMESDAQLVPLYGPGHTGIINLGNTCYMNSVMQVLFTIPEFIQRYHENAIHFFKNPKRDAIPDDFHCQLAKFARGLMSGEHSKPPTTEEIAEEQRRTEKMRNDAERAKAEPGWIPEVDPLDFPTHSERGIRPLMFKTLVGRGHPEFSTNRQQDSLEFFTHLLELIARNEHARGDVDVAGLPTPDPTSVFRFSGETRFECGITGQVGYKNSIQPYVTVPVPLANASNASEVAAYEAARAEAEKVSKEAADAIPVVLPRFTLSQCLDSLFATEAVEDWYSPAANQKTIAYKSFKFQTFPQYLALQIAKFKADASWVPKKIQMALEVPDLLDLEAFRGKGLLPSETALPDAPAEPASAGSNTSSGASASEPLWDESVVASLVEMGIPAVRAQRASHFNPGAGLDIAMDWVFSHGEDADIDEPVKPKAQNVAAPANPAPNASSDTPGENLIAQVMDMGFGRTLAIKALKNTGNDVARAVDWLFSHPDDDGSEDPIAQKSSDSVAEAAPALNPAQLKDGPGKYQLFAFVSHMGSSTMSGHYVCHILKDGKWVSFNDEKVAESLHPPREMAYLYFYKRIE